MHTALHSSSRMTKTHATAALSAALAIALDYPKQKPSRCTIANPDHQKAHTLTTDAYAHIVSLIRQAKSSIVCDQTHTKQDTYPAFLYHVSSIHPSVIVDNYKHWDNATGTPL